MIGSNTFCRHFIMINNCVIIRKYSDCGLLSRKFHTSEYCYILYYTRAKLLSGGIRTWRRRREKVECNARAHITCENRLRRYVCVRLKVASVWGHRSARSCGGGRRIRHARPCLSTARNARIRRALYYASGKSERPFRENRRRGLIRVPIRMCTMYKTIEKEETFSLRTRREKNSDFIRKL